MGGPSAFERLTTPAGLTHQPGLDGLRGIAVAAVVLFHLGIGVARGGYLGVTLFFTLSGVLIGTLVLDELTRSGGFSLRRFWARRARRLLPAALVTLAVIAVARHVTTRLADTSGADVAAAALDVANWRFVASGESYADLFGGPSAVLHFWSLSIEAQFYLAGSVLTALVAIAKPRRPVLVVGVSAGLLAAASFLLPLVAGFGIDRIYYGTDTRAGELMVGVAVAALIASPRRRAAIVGAARPLSALALIALAGLLTLCVTQTPGTEALRNGLLPLTTAVVVLVIIGALLPIGPVAVFTRHRGLVWLGRVSYSWYLVHWPVIVVANQVSTDRSLLRSAAIVAVSLALAQLCAFAVERPVRMRMVPAYRLGAAAALVVSTLGVAIASDGRRSASADLLAGLAAETGERAAANEGGTDPTRPRVAIFGDSVAFSMLLSLGGAQVPADYDRAPSETDIGCGIALSPWPPADDPYRCDLPAERFFQRARGEDLTAAVMISCQWELVAQRIPVGDDDTVRTIGNPVIDEFIYQAYDHVATRLRDAGVERILWARCPYMSQSVGVDGLSPDLLASRDPARIDALNAIINRLAGARDDVDILPLDEWVNERTDDSTIRPDGSHYDYRVHNAASDAFVEMVNDLL